MKSEQEEFYETIARQIYILHARIDAITTLGEILASKAGISRDKYYSALETIRETSVQKYLEKIEGQSPIMACRLDFPRDLTKIDQSLLDELQDGDQP